MFKAHFFDGKTSKPYDVEVKITTIGINVSIIDAFRVQELRWNHNQINRLEKQGQKVILHLGEKFPFATLMFFDDDCLLDLERFGGDFKYMKSAHYWFSKIGMRAYFLAVFGIVGFVLFVNFVLIPVAQSIVVSNISIEYEKSLSAQYLGLMHSTQQVDSLKSIQLKQFIDELNLETEYEVEAFVVESPIVNAMALPGGYMIVYTGIIDKMTRSEQLVALLGHELGHVEKKHGLKQLVNSLSKSYILKLLIGDSNLLLENLGGVVQLFGQMAYSRAAEREADEFGYNVLLNNQLDPNGMVELFEILKEESGEEVEDAQKLLSMLSSHPLTDDRISDSKERIEKENVEFIQNEKTDQIFEVLSLKSNEIE